MTIGISLFLIALGAILRFAVNDSIEQVDLTTVGLILIIVGVVGLGDRPLPDEPDGRGRLGAALTRATLGIEIP